MTFKYYYDMLMIAYKSFNEYILSILLTIYKTKTLHQNQHIEYIEIHRQKYQKIIYLCLIKNKSCTKNLTTYIRGDSLRFSLIVDKTDCARDEMSDKNM